MRLKSLLSIFGTLLALATSTSSRPPTRIGNQPRLVKAFSGASDNVPQNVVKDTFLPLHRGALHYYREKGINIPDVLVAPTN